MPTVVTIDAACRNLLSVTHVQRNCEWDYYTRCVLVQLSDAHGISSPFPDTSFFRRVYIRIWELVHMVLFVVILREQ